MEGREGERERREKKRKEGGTKQRGKERDKPLGGKNGGGSMTMRFFII